MICTRCNPVTGIIQYCERCRKVRKRARHIAAIKRQREACERYDKAMIDAERSYHEALRAMSPEEISEMERQRYMQSRFWLSPSLNQSGQLVEKEVDEFPEFMDILDADEVG